MRVNLVDKGERHRTSIEIAAKLRKDLKAVSARYPESTIQVVEDPPGPPMRATVLAEIYGNDGEQLRAASEKVRNAFRSTYDMVETTTTEPTDIPEARFEVDQEKASLAGVFPAEAALALRRYTQGKPWATATRRANGLRSP